MMLFVLESQARLYIADAQPNLRVKQAKTEK